MYVDREVTHYARKKCWREYKRLIDCNKWWIKTEPEVEFYLYLDWKTNNPKERYFAIDILGQTRQIYRAQDKNLAQLCEKVTKLVNNVKTKYYEQFKT